MCMFIVSNDAYAEQNINMKKEQPIAIISTIKFTPEVKERQHNTACAIRNTKNGDKQHVRDPVIVCNNGGRITVRTPTYMATQ